MNCRLCGTRMRQASMVAAKTWKGRTFTFHGVWGWKCPCGKQVYAPPEVQRMELRCELELAREEAARYKRIAQRTLDCEARLSSGGALVRTLDDQQAAALRALFASAREAMATPNDSPEGKGDG